MPLSADILQFKNMALNGTQTNFSFEAQKSLVVLRLGYQPQQILLALVISNFLLLMA